MNHQIKLARRLLLSNVATISFSQLSKLDRCPEEFQALASQEQQKNTPDEVVGNVTHAIAEHGKKSRVVERLIEREIAQLPVEQRQEAKAEIEQIVKNAEEMKQSEATPRKHKSEVTYRWHFAAANCTLFARPDWADIVTDENGEEVLEILDYKKGEAPSYAKRKDKDQAFFFGLVVGKALGWEGPIRLKIRYWKSKSEFAFFFSHARSGAQLREIQVKIERARSYIAAKAFPAKPGFWCDRCPLFDICEKGIRYTEVVSGRVRAPLPVIAPVVAEAPAKQNCDSSAGLVERSAS